MIFYLHKSNIIFMLSDKEEAANLGSLGCMWEL